MFEVLSEALFIKKIDQGTWRIIIVRQGKEALMLLVQPIVGAVTFTTKDGSIHIAQEQYYFDS